MSMILSLQKTIEILTARLERYERIDRIEKSTDSTDFSVNFGACTSLNFGTEQDSVDYT